MVESKYLDFGISYIISQLQRVADEKYKRQKNILLPFVTFSRESGAGGETIFEKTFHYLSDNDKLSSYPWCIFDKNLIHQVLEDHHLQKDITEEIAEAIPEKKYSHIEEVLEELFGLRPSKRQLILKTNQTIVRLAEMGNVILVGRGAFIITRKIPGGLHVRIIGSEERRIKHLQEYYGLSRRNAIKHMKEENEGRAKYIKKVFGKNIEDPLLYDLVINSDHISDEEAADIIGSLVLRKSKKLTD
jgi:cytidylate kinase